MSNKNSTNKTKPSKLDEDQKYRLWWLLLAVAHTMSKARSRELHKYGITREQTGILHIIQRTNGICSPVDISRSFFREPHTVSNILKRMEEAGLILRVRDLEKKNMIRLVVTDKGREAFLNSTKRESIYEIMSILSEKDVQQLSRYLRRLLDKSIQVGMKKPGEFRHFFLLE